LMVLVTVVEYQINEVSTHAKLGRASYYPSKVQAVQLKRFC
jgi:hypothetical protein